MGARTTLLCLLFMTSDPFAAGQVDGLSDTVPAVAVKWLNAVASQSRRRNS
jgi:hypothetical protein